MRIKNVSMTGFKSFVDRVEMDFPKGVTAIVGPNGCGKSNIIDAIRWVLGEQSTKRLRGKVMEDLIFTGSTTKGPLGMAEVNVTFENGNGSYLRGREEFHQIGPELEVDRDGGRDQFSDIISRIHESPEIVVTRRIYRSGESEYYINKVPCLLRNIIDMFLDTGVGHNAYSIIEQSDITRIIDMRPEERRLIIEEAAGISKYRRRKQEAERKMEATKINLARAKDIMGEVERQLRFFSRQARKALRYKELLEKLKKAEINLAFLRYSDLEKAKVLEEREILEYGDSLDSHHVKISHLEADKEGLKLELVDCEKRYLARKDEIHQCNLDIARCEERSGGIKQQRGRVKDRIIGLENGTKDMEIQQGDLKAEISSLRDEMNNISCILEDTREHLTSNKEELERCRKEYSDLEEEQERFRGVYLDVLTEQSATKNNITSLGERKEGLNKRMERNRVKLENLRDDLTRVQDKIRDGERVREDLAGRETSLNEERNEAQNRHKTLEEEMMRQGDEIELIKEEVSRKGSRLNSLEELEIGYEGYSEGVRAIMSLRGRRMADESPTNFINGIKGVVADVVEWDQQHDRPVSALVGERLQYIIVDDLEVGLKAVNYLKGKGLGRAAFIPFDVVTDGMSKQVPSSWIIHPDKDYKGLEAYLLRDVKFVETLEEAIKEWNKNRYTYVTREGEVIDSYGVIHGGLVPKEDMNLITRKREIHNLRVELEDLKGKLQEKSDQYLSLKGEIDSLLGLIEGIKKEEHENQLRLVEIRRDLKGFEDERETLRDTFELLTLEEREMELELKDLEYKIDNLESRFRELELSRSENESRHKQYQGALSSLRAKVEDLEEKANSMESQIILKKEQMKNKEEMASRSMVRLKEIEKVVNEMLEEMTRLKAEEVELEENLEAFQEEIKSLVEKRGHLESLRNKEESGLHDLNQRLEGIENDLDAYREKVSSEEKEKASHEMELAKICFRMGGLEDEIHDKYGLRLAEIERMGLEVYDEGALEDEIAGLKKKKDRFGDVNLGAESEYEELKERHQILSEQIQDLTRSIESLKRIIARINKVTRIRFRETFEKVNEEFQKVFSRLMSGGKAGLILLSEEDLLESGVEITVRPPGKRLKNINLLSGGEKAITVVALLFALFMTNPSPFCLLDEVDAALDDANILRFVQTLKELADDYQFILVTHNKLTMETANTLYGVTMEESGVSKLVSVRLN